MISFAMDLLYFFSLHRSSNTELQNEEFKCEFGYNCTVQQTRWTCDDFLIEDPPILIKRPLVLVKPSKTGWITGMTVSLPVRFMLPEHVQDQAYDLLFLESARLPSKNFTMKGKSSIVRDTLCTPDRAVCGFKFDQQVLNGEQARPHAYTYRSDCTSIVIFRNIKASLRI